MNVGARLLIAFVVLIITIAMRVNSVIVEEKSMTLDEAITAKLITTECNGLGGHSGNCIKLIAKNSTAKKYSILIPAGTMFKPSDDEAQNILVPQDQIFVVNPRENKVTQVSGFCCEATDHSPAKDMAFTISKNADPKMKQLFTFLKGKKYSDDILQEAVWIISNNHEVTDMYSENFAQVKPLREELCKITGQVDKWYNTPQKHEVDEEGNISHETTRVNGMIAFKALKVGKIHNEIWDANDKLVIKNPNEFTLQPGNIEYEFDIKVGGWQKGTYYVKVFEDAKVIHKQEFKI